MTMPWLKHRLRDADVWAKVDASGALVTDRDGRVEIVYKPADGQKSTVQAGATCRDLRRGRRRDRPPAIPLRIAMRRSRSSIPAAARERDPRVDRRRAAPATPARPASASSSSMAKSGESFSEYLGEGTNNIAELTAIMRGLEEVKDKARPGPRLHRLRVLDRLLSEAGRPKANVELIAELRDAVPRVQRPSVREGRRSRGHPAQRARRSAREQQRSSVGG